MIKFGFSGRLRMQRYRCKSCGETDSVERTTGAMRLPVEKIIRIVELLVEGVGVRAIERLVDVHRDTVLNVVELAGNRSLEIFNHHVLGISVNAIQVDELYAFVGKKERNCLPYEVELGDQYTYLAIDPITKLVLSYHIGKRDEENTNTFIRDLSLRVNTNKKFDITSDGFVHYSNVIAEKFYANAAYAQLIKNFHLLKIAKARNERINFIQCYNVFGKRENQSISTSYIERLNLTVRTFNRRFTRRGIGYSKKLSNLRHSVALFVAHYNFCRIHSTLRTTPAVTAGICDKPLTIMELLSF